MFRQAFIFAVAVLALLALGGGLYLPRLAGLGLFYLR